MKLSKFNIEKILDEGLLIYNSYSSGVLFLNEEYKEAYYAIKNQNFYKEDLVNELKKGSMLVEDNMDEIGSIKFNNNLIRSNENSLSLTLAPTMECNFACPYCFEEGYRHNKMTPIVEKKVIDFIKNDFENKERLDICWYGGEPLMGLKSIINITKALWEIPRLKENYSADIVTNGFYLNRKNALILKELGIKRAQITLDGPPDIHDTRRVPQNGRPTFESIMNNIQEVCGIINISIRVNVDKSNISRVVEILDILDDRGLKNKVGFYIASVDDTMDENPNPLCFNDKEFSYEEIEFYIAALKKGYNLINVPGQLLGVCGAVSLNSYVIDPLGDLYKCWDEIGRKEFSVGNVFKGPEFNSVLSNYLNYEAISDEKCIDCAVLPACMGGCPNINIRTKTRRCSSILYNAEKVMELLYTNS
ncbi:hypothetical protein IGJ55_003018 [Enterococcus sp. AZ170]|uniref:SPASM domain-containing protein n=1 Tax=unclassified Enterococcus TaxID=2608891 RepID=UPI003D291572